MRDKALTLRFGLLRFVAPSKASASRDAIWAEPRSTRYPSACRAMIVPRTNSRCAGMYYITQSMECLQLRWTPTRFELPSTQSC